MFNTDTIANKFRLSYLLFTILLCATFIAIFEVAEDKIEALLVQSYLLQQLQLTTEVAEASLQSTPVTPGLGVSIYPLSSAPQALKAQATSDIQKKSVVTKKGQEADLYFFNYHYEGHDYLLSYLDTGATPQQLPARYGDSDQYPVLALFEELEAIFLRALVGVILLSILMAFIFSYLSSKAIIKPLLDLKDAVEADQHNFDELTDLPSEVGILARAIDDKNNKLEQYLKREQLFTGDVSHELRTPLTIIMGASEVLQAQLSDHPKALEFTQRINTTAKETSEIISALLLLSRAPEKLDAPKICINHIAQSEVTRLSYLLQYKRVTCRIEAAEDYHTFVRPELLKMALGNLIKNAFQYTDSGEVVIVIDEQSISVSDTGLGIPDHMMPLLYKRFERIEPKELKVEGSGLGLSIVQRIMSHLGWRLTHSSNKAGGSTFTIHYGQAR
ncbi:sensor histidine kinase [Psychrobacter raelei]|uniref:sensor histidine kinase n=1 Tax=Psychrobacter raelei TaxID=2565531 RepID=UPI003F635579